MKIKYQFFCLFLLTTTLLITTASVIVYQYGREMLLNSVYARLESISEAKKIMLQDIIKKKEEIVYLIADNLTTNSEKIDTKPELAPFITKVLSIKKEIPSLKDFHIAGQDGKIVFSLYNKPSGKEQWVPESVMTRVEEYSMPYLYKTQVSGDHLFLKFCVPVAGGNAVATVFIVDIDGSDVLSLSRDYTGLGATGETIIAQKDSSIKFISSLRFIPESLNYRMPLNKPAEVITRAFVMKKGILTDLKDYKGDYVFASVRYIPETGWALATKIDKKEAMKPIRRLRNILIAFNLISLGIIAGVALLAGKYFTEPISALKNRALRIRDGDLSQPVQIYAANEIGELTEAFDDMALRLDAKIRELKQSNESLNKFAYVISHDLKSPLQSIRGLCGILREEYFNKPLDKEGRQILDMLTSRSLKMEEMVQGILESAKGGTKTKEKERIDSYKLVNEVIDNLNPPPHIRIKIEKDLPLIRYNKVSLIQIFQNLLSNAIKYNDKPEGLIEVGAIKVENKIKFFVRDNGPGIKESDYNKIFIMFEAGKERKDVESHGIGLSIVKKIITQNGGEIWLESKVGEGTTFYFTIPTNHH